MSRSVEKQFRVVTRQLEQGLDAIEATLRGGHLSEEAVLDLRLVAEEILTNLEKYGHDDEAEHCVRIRLTLVPGEVTLEFTDDGRPFDPRAAKQVDRASGEERRIGGLGLELVRSLVDAVEYARRGSENVLTLTKRVGAGGGAVT